MKERLLEILGQYWGYDSFREGQYEIISSVLSGYDTLALMPTGGGKSITYQLPTLASDGLCIVITPLIALMKDQVDRLRQRGISAVAIHSGLSKRKIDIALDNCVYGDVKFLYVAPERLNSDIFRLRARRMNISLIAVDEAHCISQWGYDFRPAYLHIKSLRELHPDVPVLALTASATDEVARDIMENLDFDEHRTIRTSFTRPNLSYVVRHVEDKDEQLMRIVGSVQGAGIVYVRKRETAERLCEFLKQQGVSASFYHGGLPNEERSIRQEEWVSGKVRVMVATNAFGMGIDKSNVRFVVHYTMCDSMESYYQEAGRAGRDGERSYAVLMVSPDDRQILSRRLDSTFPPIEQVKALYEKICSYLMIALGDGAGHSYAFNIQEFCRHERLFPTTVLGAIDLLERNEYLSYLDVADNPARLIFKVGRDDLYKYKMSELVDGVVRTLLRMYNGLFTEFRAIDEEYIAAAGGYTREQVHLALKDLWRSQIIRYVPANSLPMIYMNEERLPLSSLYISPRSYGHRREQMQRRFDSMVAYAEDSKQCRSVTLARYFGDTSATECGICDVCLARKREPKNEEALHSLILEVLQSGGVSLREIARRVPAQTKTITDMIYRMLESGEVTIDGANVVSLSDRGSASDAECPKSPKKGQ
ncbi:MAG: RecQ family ATP-dependent DNA helicase [Alistipes sp.]|nr:RecQ family ATP-dependent DNA helicase [Alistipes sp.]